MNGIFKYRIVAICLAAVFTLFNVGIPVLIASCPMAALMQGNACPMCDTQDPTGASTVTRETNNSCCTTFIVAERNTNEFLQVKERILQAGMVTLLPGFSQTVSTLSPSFSTVRVSSSPPAFFDIPILTASLLI